MADTQEQKNTAPEDEEIDETPGYVPPAQKSLKEITEQDKDDESLEKYKKTLLGDVNLDVSDATGPNVVVEKLTIFFPDEPDRPEVVLDLTGDISQLRKETVTIKEGTVYKLKISFRVKREIVAGLRYFQVTYRKGIRVDKSSLMVGSYGPKADLHEYIAPADEAPKGLVSRGHYEVKSKFTDDDKNSILSWEWSFDITKDWK